MIFYKLLICFTTILILFGSCENRKSGKPSIKEEMVSVAVDDDNMCMYDSLPEDVYSGNGEIIWGKLYYHFIRTNNEIAELKIDTSIVSPDFSRFKKEKFVKSEYTKYQHFNLWELKGYGKVDSTVFLYIRQTPDNIVIRFSDNVDEPLVILKVNNRWILNYEYQMNYDMCRRYDLYEYRNIYGFLSDSLNSFVEETYCTEIMGEYYNSFWWVSKDEVRHISEIRFHEYFKLCPGSLEFVEFLHNSPEKYLSEDIETKSGKSYNNPLILGAGGYLQERNLNSIHFLAKSIRLDPDELP